MFIKFWKLLRRFGVHGFRICNRQLDTAAAKQLEIPPGLEIRLGDDATLRSLIDTSEHFERSFVERSLERGDLCALVYRGDEMLAFSWRTREWVPFVPGIQMALTRDDAFIGYKTWVDPQVRGLRLFEKMRLFLDGETMARGINLGVSYIEQINESSWASMRRDPLSAQVGWSLHFRPLGWSIRSAGAKDWVKFQPE